jgi:hypothetical protein
VRTSASSPARWPLDVEERAAALKAAVLSDPAAAGHFAGHRTLARLELLEELMLTPSAGVLHEVDELVLPSPAPLLLHREDAPLRLEELRRSARSVRADLGPLLALELVLLGPVNSRRGLEPALSPRDLWWRTPCAGLDSLSAAAAEALGGRRIAFEVVLPLRDSWEASVVAGLALSTRTDHSLRLGLPARRALLVGPSVALRYLAAGGTSVLDRAELGPGDDTEFLSALWRQGGARLDALLEVTRALA